MALADTPKRLAEILFTMSLRRLKARYSDRWYLKKR